MLAINGMQGLASGLLPANESYFSLFFFGIVPSGLLGWSRHRRPLKLNKMILSQAKYCFKKHEKCLIVCLKKTEILLDKYELKEC